MAARRHMMRDRTRLPAWVNRTIDYIADHPMSPLGRVAAARYGRPDRTVIVPVTRFDDARRRVLITPVNYSGQGTAWARAIEQFLPSVSARSMAIDVPGGFSYPADLVVPVPTYHNDSSWQRRQLEAARHATHVLIEAAEPPFGRLLDRRIDRQADALLQHGVSVAFMGHGTEIRLPSRHREVTPWSYYRDDSVYLPRLEEIARRTLLMMASSGRPLFVSTPDLLRDLPSAEWCPVVVEIERWAGAATDRSERIGPLRVVHAPSNPVLKGTPLILPALERLSAVGQIELALIAGVASERMPAVIGDADVVLDQFRLGSYGAVACEAMASGCVVVGHVTEDVRETVRTLTGRPLPIVEATPADVDEVIAGLAADPDRRAQLGRDGRDFVAAVHDGSFSAATLGSWLDSSSAREAL